MLLIDTNIVIASHRHADNWAKEFVRGHDVCCSVIIKVETLGFARIEDFERANLAAFLAAIDLLPVDDAVIEYAIVLRQRRNMGLGDALIAGTALVHGLELITRNIDDFRWIDELVVFNPYPDHR